MGDRTYCQIEIAAASREQLEELFDNHGFALQDENDVNGLVNGRVTFEDSEANYGGSSCLEDLDKTGQPYFGYHDAGGDYGPTLFAFEGKNRAECIGIAGDPLCLVNEDGEPNPSSLQAARDYVATKKAALDAMTPEYTIVGLTWYSTDYKPDCEPEKTTLARLIEDEFSEVDEQILREMKPGDTHRIGGGAAAAFEIRRVK